MIRGIAAAKGFSLDLRAVIAIWRQHYESFARYVRVNITWIVVEPVIVLVAMAIGVGRLVGEVEEGLSYPVFVTPGLIIGHAMFLALFETSWNAYSRIKSGVYETQMTAPVTIFEITLGDIAWATTRSVLSVAAITVFAAAFGWLGSWWAVGLIVPAILAGVLFGAIGYLFSTTVPYVSFLSIVFTLVATPLFFFSGTFFPLSVLPEWAQILGALLPLKPLVDISRGLSIGELDIGHLWDLLYVLGLIVFFWTIAVVLLRRRLMRSE